MEVVRIDSPKTISLGYDDATNTIEIVAHFPMPEWREVCVTRYAGVSRLMFDRLAQKRGDDLTWALFRIDVEHAPTFFKCYPIDEYASLAEAC